MYTSGICKMLKNEKKSPKIKDILIIKKYSQDTQTAINLMHN